MPEMNKESTRLYVVVRKELGDSHFVVHMSHAIRETAFIPGGLVPSEDEVAVILKATKAQMVLLKSEVEKHGIPVKVCQEISGKMAGSVLSMGFAVYEKDKTTADRLTAHLKRWEPPRSTRFEEDGEKKEARIDAAAKELTELLRENGHGIDDVDDQALLQNVLARYFLTEGMRLP